MAALFRKGASDTSIEAANSIKTPTLEQMIYKVIKASRKKGITQDELLALFPDLSYSSVTARPAALKEQGLVVDSGRRRPGRTGRYQMVLIASEYAEVAE